MRAQRPDEIRDFLHAGLCEVVDKRTNRSQEHIQVVVTHNPERRGGGGSREFRFPDGTAFSVLLTGCPKSLSINQLVWYTDQRELPSSGPSSPRQGRSLGEAHAVAKLACFG
jgi:hypothetical protein